ncbi:uncharacterized protein LOC106650599 isoform X1 [Trichogramma pretiosum]|uniref:uncharacterized protein LOC106650599 isoform X1 n=1 Tax=Trichogramma pretiosum TaxID=7493 RepID=UPI0006C98536|nr:uncharacterized protein LOC106650599 isoform X1 [Trichogramma pretiosum]
MFAKTLTSFLHCNNKDPSVASRLNLFIRCISKTNFDTNLPNIERNRSTKDIRKSENLSESSISRQAHKKISKHFKSTEINFARKVLEKSDDYSNSLSTSLTIKQNLSEFEIQEILDKQWQSMSNGEVLQNLESLSNYAYKNPNIISVYDEKGVMRILKTRCMLFNDDEFRLFLKNLEQLQGQNKKIIQGTFWRIINAECFKRSSNWTIEEILMMNDQLAKLDLTWVPFYEGSLLKMEANFSKFSPANLVQYAYLIRISSKKINVNFKQFEYHVHKSVDRLTIEEIGIISMAYFRYETSLKHTNLLLHIMTALENNIDSVSEMSLAAILKILRYSVSLKLMQRYNILIELLIEQIPKRTLLTLIHVAHMQAMLLLDNEKLTLGIANRYINEVQTARIKDIERILFTLYIFNYGPEKTLFYDTAYQEFLESRRNNEINNFPFCLVYSVMYMLQVNYYPEKLIKKIMDPDFIKNLCNGDIHKLDREYIVIHYCLVLDHPQYNGPLLRRDMLQFLIKKCRSNSKIDVHKQQIPMVERIITDIVHTCKQMIGFDEVAHVDCVLPHFVNNDIILCYNEDTKEFFNPKNKLVEMEAGTLKHAPKDGNKWIALTLAGHNVLTRNSKHHTGAMEVRLRHLKKVGYTPYVVRKMIMYFNSYLYSYINVNHLNFTGAIF